MRESGYRTNFAGPVSSVHGSIVPVEVRSEQLFSAEIVLNTTAQSVRLWRISPLGADFLTSESFSEGSSLFFRVRIIDEVIEIEGQICGCVKEKESSHLVSVRWVFNQSDDEKKKRSKKRWKLNPLFLPTITCDNKLSIQGIFIFNVIDISTDGLKIRCSKRNKELLPKMILSGNFNFPSSGQFSTTIKIVWVAEDENHLIIGCEFLKMSRKIKEIIGHYCFQFAGESTIKSLKESDFLLPKKIKTLRISDVRTSDDYDAVVKLRDLCFRPIVPKEKFGNHLLYDRYDSRSRILRVDHLEKTVATLRMIFHSENDDFAISDHIDLPDDFPDQADSVEVTKVCVHPDFRSSLLITLLLRKAIVGILEAQRTYFVGTAPVHLKAFYKRIGAKIVPLTYEHDGQSLSVVLVDVLQAIKGKGVSPHVWSYVYGPAALFAVDKGIIELDMFQRLRIKLYNYLFSIIEKIDFSGFLKK